MKVTLQAPRGTQDQLPSEAALWDMIEKGLAEEARVAGFEKIVVPTFEYTELFHRSVGEGTDVVQKEMFTFEDRGGRSLTLRPEGTAGVLRAVLQHGLLQNQPLPLKLCYQITCFRNERPQAGRFKEFHQFGVEMFGSSSPYADVEVIELASRIFSHFDIENLELNINSIGCAKCRAEYRKALQEYFAGHKDNLCKTCKERLTANPLRLLDCKEESCAALAKDAPSILDYLCDECKEHFDTVCSSLKSLEIPFKINPKIVRGLDYYTRTVFEFVSNDLGAQGAVCGGGRYDGLIEEMGGASQPALGFAIGIERILAIWQKQHPSKCENAPCAIYIAHRGEEGAKEAMKLALKMRKEGIFAEFDSAGKSLKAQMKYADKKNARYSVVLGEEEMQTHTALLKDMSTGEGEKVALEKIVETLKRKEDNQNG